MRTRKEWRKSGKRLLILTWYEQPPRSSDEVWAFDYLRCGGAPLWPEAALMTDDTWLNMTLILLATLGMRAPAATEMKPPMRAYSRRSWPRRSFRASVRKVRSREPKTLVSINCCFFLGGLRFLPQPVSLMSLYSRLVNEVEQPTDRLVGYRTAPHR